MKNVAPSSMENIGKNTRERFHTILFLTLSKRTCITKYSPIKFLKNKNEEKL